MGEDRGRIYFYIWFEAGSWSLGEKAVVTANIEKLALVPNLRLVGDIVGLYDPQPAVPSVTEVHAFIPTPRNPRSPATTTRRA